MSYSSNHLGELWYNQGTPQKSEQDEYMQSFHIGNYGKKASGMAPSLRKSSSDLTKRRKIRPISSLCAKKANLPACFLADPK